MFFSSTFDSYSNWRDTHLVRLQRNCNASKISVEKQVGTIDPVSERGMQQ
jgi:hypothetical protein